MLGEKMTYKLLQLTQCWQTFSIINQIVNIFRFCGLDSVFVLKIQLCCCMKAAIDPM